MDDYLLAMNINKCIGNEKDEYSTATNISIEEHEMQILAPEKDQHQPLVNQRPMTRRGNRIQEDDLKNDLRGSKKCFIVMAVIILALTVLMSLIAIALSIVGYSATDHRTFKEAKLSEFQFNTYEMDTAFALKQLNDTLIQLYSVQNNIQLSLEQLRIETNSVINQLTENISNLAIQLNDTNNDIQSVATSVESDICQLSTQLDASNSNIATTIKTNISQLLCELDAVYSALSLQAQAIRVHCGDGLWYRVAYLNMSDPSQQCPSPWRMYGTDNISLWKRI